MNIENLNKEQLIKNLKKGVLTCAILRLIMAALMSNTFHWFLNHGQIITDNFWIGMWHLTLMGLGYLTCYNFIQFGKHMVVYTHINKNTEIEIEKGEDNER